MFLRKIKRRTRINVPKHEGMLHDCLNLGFSGHATIALVLWIHCFHLHVLTSDVVSLLPFLDSISLIIIVVQCRV